MLLDVAPRALTDWFWAAYVDAYDLLTTKPYVAGAAYIHKLSDYCGGCRFDPKTTCPLTPMSARVNLRASPSESARGKVSSVSPVLVS